MPNLAAAAMRSRRLMRAPIWLFRARLGFLFRGRFVLLEHRGRTSGKPRYVVLETAQRPDPSTVYIASGFGPKAQWYQNLLAEPRCRLSIGRRHRAPALARPLDDEQAAEVLTRYQKAHPKAYDTLSGLVENLQGDGATVPIVELSLRGRNAGT